MLGELNTPDALSVWDKILLIKSKIVHALKDKILKTRETGVRNSPYISIYGLLEKISWNW